MLYPLMKGYQKYHSANIHCSVLKPCPLTAAPKANLASSVILASLVGEMDETPKIQSGVNVNPV